MLQSYLSNTFSVESTFVFACILLIVSFFLVLLCAEHKTEGAADAAETSKVSPKQQGRKKTITSTKKSVKSVVSRGGASAKKKKTASGPSRKSAKVASVPMKLPPKSVIISGGCDNIKTESGGKSAIKEGGVLSTGSYVYFEPRKTEKLDGQLDSIIPAPDEDPQQFGN